ncbi:MAG: DUF4177 domain-containing protein [Eubacteriales bacterium]|nr:DUF4177 domain-containing protein [Eubacteriales bacterium]
MYKYESETISSSFSGWSLIAGNISAGNVYDTENYMDLINKRAQDGWRFVCIVPTTQRSTGHIEKMDLVFEKQI